MGEQDHDEKGAARNVGRRLWWKGSETDASGDTSPWALEATIAMAS